MHEKESWDCRQVEAEGACHSCVHKHHTSYSHELSVYLRARTSSRQAFANLKAQHSGHALSEIEPKACAWFR